jgi:hypothetical protein
MNSILKQGIPPASPIIILPLNRNCFHMLCLWLSMLSIPEVLAQDTSAYVKDSIMVKKGSYFLIDDKIIQVKKDTVFVFVDSLKYSIGNTDDETFYRELKEEASKREWSKKLYDFLIIEPGEENSSQERNNLFLASRKIRNYRNKKIHDFTFRQLKVFGPSFNDTTREPKVIFEKIGNSFHTITKEKVIADNLFLKKGDRLDPEKIQDAERILRNLPFIKDVRILPIDSLSSGDSVALQVLTQDVFAYSFGSDFYGTNGGAIEVTNNNLFGLGHLLKSQLSYNRDHPEMQVGYGIKYSIPNIRRSFINAEANYYRHYYTKLTNIAISRDFISPQIKYAGGVDIGEKYLHEHFLLPESENEMDTLQSTHTYQNLWFGRAFPVKWRGKELSDRNRLVVSGRYQRKKYSERPEVTEGHNRDFHHSQLLMGSLSFSTRHYFRDRLVYSYGRTEDIPYGQRVTVSGGYERNEFSDRTFASMDLSIGRYVSALGYVYAEVLLESFYRNGKSEQGIIKPGINYFSNLANWGRFKIRNFLTLEFTKGVNRFSNESLTINREYGIRGFHSVWVRGGQRLNINYELVAFSPSYIVGFRLAPYFFYDASLLSQKNEAIFNGKYYHGFGLGCRIRNENLTFNTIVVRLGLYPNGPEDVGALGLNMSEQILTRFKDFEVRAPGVTVFR